MTALNLKKNNKKRVKALFISDTHLQLRFSRLWFWPDGSNPEAVLKVLDLFHPRLLIVNGDLLHHTKSVDFYDNELKVLLLLRQFAQPNSGTKLIIISGNHDRDHRVFIEWLIGQKCQEEYTFFHKGRKCIVTHGDRFDASLKYRRGMWLLDYAERFARLTGVFMIVKKWFDLGIWRSAHRKMMKKAIEYARKQKAAYVLVGHSHMKGFFIEGKVTCINSGCFIDDRPTVVALTEHEDFQIHEFDRGGSPIRIISPAI